MSLQTPESIRRLQRKLYLKAKAEPAFRFYLLYDKICREDILLALMFWRAPIGVRRGWTGPPSRRLAAAGLEEWFAGLRKDRQQRAMYRPESAQQDDPGPGGGERPLGIPTIQIGGADRRLRQVLEPIFEADLDPAAYGYRPGRSGADAIKEARRCSVAGATPMWWTPICRSISTISHQDLEMRSVARRIVDRQRAAADQAVAQNAGRGEG